MNQHPDLIAAVSSLSEEHSSAPFPPGLTGADRAGFDLVLPDSDISGCVATWLHNGGHLDDRRYRILHWRMSQLSVILTELRDDDCPAYWDRLFRMGQLVASTDPTPRDPAAPTAPRPAEHPVEPTPQELLADLYGYDQDAHFDTTQLREGLAQRIPLARLDKFLAAVKATGDPAVDLETATALLDRTR
ncbi:hypothetical protein [Streptomyces erythrochromogenes]|uniref:hypothetical protein n=1 Tax=Streptomyces erythrochromogenes TaxID=285574 RepID=UPI00381925F5